MRKTTPERRLRPRPAHASDLGPLMRIATIHRIIGVIVAIIVTALLVSVTVPIAVKRDTVKTVQSYEYALNVSIREIMSNYDDPQHRRKDMTVQAIEKQDRRDEKIAMKAIEDDAKAAGVTVVWDVSDDTVPCKPSQKYKGRFLNGLFCGLTPNVIYMNPEADKIHWHLRNGFTASVLRHELAHRTVFKVCGTVDPKIDKGRSEALANAYAVSFYGADLNLLQEDHDKEYQTKQVDFDAANSIHDGKCR